MKRIVLYLALLTTLGCSSESQLFIFQEGMGCGIGFYTDSQYQILIRGCMEECPIIYLYQKGKQIEQIVMLPGFSGVDTILHDTIYISYCSSHPSEFNAAKVHFNEFYKGRFKVVPQCIDRGYSKYPYQKLEKTWTSLDYNANTKTISIHSSEEVLKKSIHKMNFNGGVLSIPSYSLNVTNEYFFDEKTFTKLGKAILHNCNVSIQK